MNEALDQLCARCGVLPQYLDIWGEAHAATEAAKRAVLRAMGIEAGTDEQAAAALLDLDRREWRRPLRPVLVARGAGPYLVPVTLPEADAQPCRWRLVRESGAEDAGEFLPAGLAETGRRSIDGETFVQRTLALDLVLDAGYHTFSIERADSGQAGPMSFIVAPETCFEPRAIQGDGRVWGFSAQLYGVRSERDWGIGDLGDLRRMLEFCAEAGADAVLLNPLHALFPDNPDHTCPYSPSNRAYFNTLYLDVEAVAEFGECQDAQAMVEAPAFQAQLRALRAEPRVAYRAVAELKAAVLERLYQHFRDEHLARDTGRARAFHAYRAAHGESLRRQALFDVLQEHFRREDASIWGWPVWPEAYRDPDAPAVAAFAREHLERAGYFEYLQWQVAEQLAAAGRRSWELGLGIGVVLDLAVGVARGGSATWTRPGLYALDASAGAPPDEINRIGQDWGLPPWIPQRLTELAYEPFIELLRAQMVNAGALRMDHVMGLCRLYWVAPGLPVAQGAYVAYPFSDLLGILALESQRNQCLVMGEDLGTVPDEVRLALRPMGVMSTRLLYFERLPDGRLQPPQAYPVNAVAAVTTHDLATLAGYWQGLDIDLRTELRLFPDDEARNQQIVARAEDRVQLLLALEGEGLVPAGSGLHPGDFPEMTAELAAAVYTYLARAPSKLLLVQLEDGFGVREQPNLPGTTEPAYPSWRLKQPVNLEDWRAHPWLQGILQALRQERPVVRAPEGGAGAAGLRSWIPRATYRLQLHRDFNLAQAAALMPYLDELGFSHFYLSPLLKARPGSLHGYDITDHSCLNPEIASLEELDRFAAALRERGMGQIMDIVPNHMGIMGDDNRWWLDVLENGPASRFANYFDIDWHALASGHSSRVLLPVLGDHYGLVLERGELRLSFDPDQGAFSVTYFEHRFPVDPREYPRILGHDLDRLQARVGAGNGALLEFQSLITAFAHLPAREGPTPETVAERGRDKEIHKHHLAALCAASADLAQFVQENLAVFNGAAAGAAAFDPMHELLEAQAYRLSYWRVAADEVNYRRFFDINTLAALRMDDPEVFENTHRLVRELLVRGVVNGLRVDHPDGMYAPRAYFERLQAMAATLGPKPAQREPRPLYLVVEKILSVHERLPSSWPVHGTTGYDFGAVCDGLFVDQAGENHCSHTYQNFIRTSLNPEELGRTNKHLIMKTLLAGELQVLATQLTRLAKSDRRTSDHTFNGLRTALGEILMSFPVYRTYVAGSEASREDIRYVDWAVGVARKRSKVPDASIFDFVRDVLLARPDPGGSPARQEAVSALAMKFQQYSGPVMAKAMEDTTFYQYNRLVSLNEVGGDLLRFGVSPAAFHQENQDRARRWPHAMLAGSTHDSKRSEDVRARISALSEMPGEWSRAISRWRKLTHGIRRGSAAPSRNDEYLLYQTLLGVWPFEAPDPRSLAELVRRVEDYMVKAGREAKERSSWVNPDPDYEEGTRGFIRALLASEAGNLFMLDFRAFHARVARIGALGSLSRQLLRLTSPGVPDCYQGDELWNFSLVDPDNRRPVDYEARRAALAAVQASYGEGGPGCARELLEHLADGRIKLYLIWRTLALRREREALFRDGDYLALKTHGRRAEHGFAFARRLRGETLVVAVPRLFHGLMEADGRVPVGAPAWAETWVEAPPGSKGPWINLLTGERIGAGAEGEDGLALAEVFRTFPYALLVPEEG